MKAENDKKNKRTSVTMTSEDYDIIEQKAKERGLAVSPFMVECSVHSHESFTPENKARIQNLVNKVCMIAEEIAPDRINEIRKEAEGLWC